jgi:serine/threonine protein kinase
MALVPAKNAEPIAGYKLVEKLGVGGYGEVWKATAPGGLSKAIKIIFGDMAGARAEQELRALGRIKEVRHPFLLSLERIEVIDGQLLIVMELAEGCLSDRYFECRKAGLKGIPRDELLGHIRDAAEALDYMVGTHGLQHLDIKPQNLLLVGKRMKIADFGLVKNLVGTSTAAPGGVTPMYATPEAFDGRVSRYSDQYSLAIVYQEMLTGVRPFPGATLMQLAAQHTNSPPLLTPLPLGDRAVIGKALSKAPEQRFGSCLKMVEALMAGGRAVEISPIAPSELLARSDIGQRLQPVPTAPWAPAGSSVGLEVHTLPKTPGPDTQDAEGTLSPSVRQASPVAHSGRPGLRPTLFLGIGNLASAVLRRVKAKVRDPASGFGEAPIFGFLLVDTDREDLRQSRLGSNPGALAPAETLLAPLHLPEYYRPQAKQFLRWLDRRWFYGIPRSLQTEGVRPLGRLALVDNAAEILSQVREALTQITSAAALQETVNATGADIRDPTPRVFVIASIAGGTGGGMVVSMAYAVRQTLGDLGLSARGLCGILLYATSPKPADQEMARINAYATLSELDFLSRPGANYPGDAEHGLLPCGAGHAPYQDTYVVHLGERLDRASAEAATEPIADYLFLDTCPHGGTFLDRFRHETRPAAREALTFRCFGLSRIDAQGERPADLAATLLCRRLAERWVAGPGEGESKYLERESQRQAAGWGLHEQSLTLREQAAVTAALGGVGGVEELVPRVLAEAAEAATGELHDKMLAHVDKVFAPKDDNPEVESAGPLLRAEIRKSAEQAGAEVGRSVLDWLLRLVETPGKRFKAAERTGTFLARELLALAETIKGKEKQADAQRRKARDKVLADKPRAKGLSRRWLPRALGGGAPNTEDDLMEYCRLWLQQAARTAALVLLGVVQKQLDSFLQDVGVCRMRLKNFTDQFRPALAAELATNAPTAPLSPPVVGCPAPPGSEAGEPEQLTPEQVFRFDRSFQVDVLERQGGMWGVFCPEKDPSQRGVNPHRPTPETLAEDLLIRARCAIQGTVKDMNAAQLFLRNNGGPEKALAVLLAHAEAARPRLRARGCWEHLVIARPEGPAGDTLSGMIAQALPDVPATVVLTEEQIILCYEVARCPLRETARALVGPADLPLELVRRVLTRLDVAWTLPEPCPV